MRHSANDRAENSRDLHHPRARSISKGAQPLQANIRAVAEIEQGALNRRTFADRFSDAFTHATEALPLLLQQTDVQKVATDLDPRLPEI